MRDVVKSHFAVEIAISARAGGEQAVSDGLGVEVRKLGRHQVGEQILLEGLVIAIELALLLLGFNQLLADDLIAQEARALG